MWSVRVHFTGLCVFSYLRWLIIVLVNSFVILAVLFHRFFGKAYHIFFPTKDSMISRGYRNDSLAFLKLNILHIWIRFLTYKDSSKQTWKDFERSFSPTLTQGVCGLPPWLSGEDVQPLPGNMAWISASSLTEKNQGPNIQD